MNGDPPFLPGWSDQQALLSIGGDPWRIKDACEGTIVLGGTGSGKTSGSGQAIARSFLRSGFGGLVLCAKSDEPGLWEQYAADTGRAADLVRFGRGQGAGFNFLAYESQRSGSGAGLTENLVNLFIEVASLGSGDGRGRGGDPFWERAMRSLVRNCVDLLLMAGEPASLHAMFDIVREAPTEPSQAASAAWQDHSACWRLLAEAGRRSRGAAWEIDYREVEGFWLRQFPGLGDRTRGSIVAMFSTMAEGLMRGKMRELFCSGSTVVPEDVLQGKIVVVDLPVKEWSELGRIAAVLWKYCLQKAIERRGDNPSGQGRPVFIWADECQHFASRHDPLFQATARSSRAATVYLTQNYPSLAASLGSGAEARTATDALLGNFGTKIFHANSDRETNQWAADLIGRRLGHLRSLGAGSALNLGAGGAWSASGNSSRSESMDYEVQPMEFSVLRKGGPENGFVSEALVLQNGRRWEASGRTWQKAAFSQRRPESLAAVPHPAAPGVGAEPLLQLGGHRR